LPAVPTCGELVLDEFVFSAAPSTFTPPEWRFLLGLHLEGFEFGRLEAHLGFIVDAGCFKVRFEVGFHTSAAAFRPLPLPGLPGLPAASWFARCCSGRLRGERLGFALLAQRVEIVLVIVLQWFRSWPFLDFLVLPLHIVWLKVISVAGIPVAVPAGWEKQVRIAG
jgi:hypothetical protein